MDTLKGVSPSNKMYVTAELYDFLESLMRPSVVTYKSDHADLVRNEIVKDQLRRFRSCVGKRK